jgi:hypothetical protein
MNLLHSLQGYRYLSSVGALSILLLCGCSTVSTVSTQLKAKPAALSPFVEHPHEMRPQRERAPYALVWIDPALPQKHAHYDSIYIAPVTTRYLRPAKTPMAEKAGVPAMGPRPEHQFAGFLRSSFREAFRYSPNRRLHLTEKPQPGGVTLRLALVELNPTDASGNVMAAAIPKAGALGAFTSGNIAIEGQVRDNVTGELLFEFADNEKDKVTVVSVRDYMPYEHAKVAIAEWARQFEELTRTSRGHKVEDSLAYSLNPL